VISVSHLILLTLKNSGTSILYFYSLVILFEELHTHLKIDKIPNL
jgi:hypothetical protein